MYNKLIFLVRHGKTDANNDFYYLQGMDLPLNKIGEAQAKKTGQFISKYYNIKNIYHSEKTRTKQTATIISKELKFKGNFIQNKYINECNHDALIGIEKQKIQSQIKQSFNKQFDTLLKNNPIFVSQKMIDLKNDLVVKKMGAESVQSIQGRVKKFISILKKTKGNTIMVSHKGLIRNFIQYVCNFAEQVDNTKSGSYCSISVLQQIGNKLILIYPTSIDHLSRI